MKKLSRVLYATSVILILLGVVMMLDTLVFKAGIEENLIRPALIILGVSFIEVGIGLVLWKRKGLSYGFLLHEMLPSFSKRSSDSEED